MATTVKTMMINRRVSKLDAVHPAGECHNLCFYKLGKKSSAFPESNFAQVARFLDRFILIDLLESACAMITAILGCYVNVVKACEGG